MRTMSEKKIRKREPLWLCILAVLALYLLQGLTLGVTDVIPLYLVSYNATWTQLGTFSFIMYPFSIKLLWAPLIDVFYIRRLGRRRTWLLPTQMMLGATFIILSFYLETLLVQLQVIKLTVILFFVVFLVATQDICVDGWALTLFGTSNIIWHSISQMIGYVLGNFFGSSFLLTFESANMTNRLIRQPLQIPEQPYGLFTLAQFLRFWGVIFFITTCGIMLLFQEQRQQQTSGSTKKDPNVEHFGLLQTYLYLLGLFKKKCFHQLLVILIGSNIGHMATAAMTFTVLIKRGLIKRETLGLITMPLIVIKITIPIVLSRTRRPLILFAHSYVPRLILCIVIALFVYFSSYLHLYPVVFYILFILLIGLSDALSYLQGVARGGFLASICDTRIASTYYTLLASISNLGSFLSSTAVLYTANWLPEEQAYYIEVGICILLGSVWFGFSWRLMYRLQAMAVEDWHISSGKMQLKENHFDSHRIISANTRKAESPSVSTNLELSSWL